MEATLRLCQLKGSPEGQLLGAITVCQELQRLLKFAFIGERMWKIGEVSEHVTREEMSPHFRFVCIMLLSPEQCVQPLPSPTKVSG